MPLRLETLNSLKLLNIRLLALAAGLLSTVSAQAADPIGSAITISNIVTAEFENDKRRLGTGDDVHQNELIEVGVDSLGELKFRDETKLALGAGSRVVLDKYVYDPDKTSGSIIMNLVKGTFRFITGIAAKPTYLIKTPHASISVRGTIFDVYVEDSGASWLLLIEGAVRVCNDSGRCRTLDEPGKLIRIDEDGKVHKPAPWKELRQEMPRKQRIKFADVDTPFPFVRRAPSFAPAPDFTDEVVTGVVIPPVIRWPSHPRWTPPTRWPNGGDPPRGNGHGPGMPWPGQNPYPGNTDSGGKNPGMPWPGHNPYPGNTDSGGKNPGTPWPGRNPYPGKDPVGGKNPDSGSTTTGIPGKGGNGQPPDIKKQTNRDRVIEAYRRRWEQTKAKNGNVKNGNTRIGNSKNGDTKIGSTKPDELKSRFLKHRNEKLKSSSTLDKIKKQKAFSHRKIIKTREGKATTSKERLQKATKFRADKATRKHSAKSKVTRERIVKPRSVKPKSISSSRSKPRTFKSHTPKSFSSKQPAAKFSSPKSFGGFRRR